jgi:hypothetical protein
MPSAQYLDPDDQRAYEQGGSPAVTLRRMILRRLHMRQVYHLSGQMLRDVTEVRMLADAMADQLAVGLERAYLMTSGERVTEWATHPDGVWAALLDWVVRHIPNRWMWTARLQARLAERIKVHLYPLETQHHHLCPHGWVPDLGDMRDPRWRVHLEWLQHGHDGTEPANLPPPVKCANCDRELAPTATVVRTWSTVTADYRWQHYGACPPGEMP